MFKRIGSLVDIELLDESELKVLGFEKIANLAQNWKQIVRESYAKSYITLQNEFDTDNFLYFKCRAISGSERYGPNGNGDFFPWKEIKAAVNTFISKGFYIEHDSDDPEKAKGIIVKADALDDKEYVECIVAVSKKDCPDICEEIKNGKIKSVSMGCLCAEAICPICNNVAHNEDELCKHMKPYLDEAHTMPNPEFVKGKIYDHPNIKEFNGKKIAYEINKKIVFNELSGVKQPADPSANIYANTIIANKKEEAKRTVMNKISFKDYKFLKKALIDNREEDFEDKIEEIVDSLLESKMDSIVKNLVKEEVSKELADKLKNLEETEDVKKEKEKPKTEKEEEKPKTEKEEEKFRTKKEDEKLEEKPKKKSEEVEIEQIKESKSVRSQLEQEIIVLGDGYELKPEIVKEKEMLRLFDRGNPTQLLVEKISEELSEIEKVNRYRQILKLEKPQVTEETQIKEGSKIMKDLTIQYIPGETFDKSYFVAKSSDGKTKVVRASLIIPFGIQKRIASGDKKVISVDEAIDQIIRECGRTYEGFLKWLPRNASLRRKAYDFFAIKQEEVATEPAKPDKITRSIREDEIKKLKIPTRTDGTKIKDYYSRFPSRTVAEPEIALNLKSKLDDAFEKISRLEDMIKMKNARIKFLEDRNESIERKAKSEDIVKLIANIETVKPLDEEFKKKLIEKLSNLNEEGLAVVAEILNIRTEKKPEGTEIISSKDNIPEIQVDEKGTESSPLQNLMDVWNMHTQAQNIRNEQ